MTRIISIVNQKGGVGKTTTAVNLGAGLACTKNRTLIIDLDPQGNSTSGVGKIAEDVNIYYNISDHSDSIVTIKTEIPLLDIIPSNVDLSAAEIELVNITHREYKIKDIISRIKNDYDYIIIDCPPSLGLLTINSLVASTDVIIPLQCEYFALEGLAHLLKTLDLIKANFNSNLNIMGVLLTMYDRRNNLTLEVERDVRSFLKNIVFETVIPRSIKLSEAPSHGLPGIIYDHKSAGAQAYAMLTREVLNMVNNNVLRQVDEYVQG